MNPAITIGDKTTHGGVVIEADQTFLIDDTLLLLNDMYTLRKNELPLLRNVLKDFLINLKDKNLLPVRDHSKPFYK